MDKDFKKELRGKQNENKKIHN